MRFPCFNKKTDGLQKLSFAKTRYWKVILFRIQWKNLKPELFSFIEPDKNFQKEDIFAHWLICALGALYMTVFGYKLRQNLAYSPVSKIKDCQKVRSFLNWGWEVGVSTSTNFARHCELYHRPYTFSLYLESCHRPLSCFPVIIPCACWVWHALLSALCCHSCSESLKIYHESSLELLTIRHRWWSQDGILEVLLQLAFYKSRNL